MRERLLVWFTFASAILLLGTIGVYCWVRMANPEPFETRSGQDDWCSISIGRGGIAIAHSLQPSRDKNHPGMFTYLYDGGNRVHFAIQKGYVRDMSGCYLVVYSQNFPYELNTSFAFAPNDRITNRVGFVHFGIKYGSGIHTGNMIGCADNDRTSATVFIGYGIFFSRIFHSVDKAQNWWTLMISLWYPIIIFAILPCVLVIKALRARLVSASGQNRPGASE
ncbi:MAG: hypothetical protein KGR98_07360 [Verrucomicrobia bacterium]|nr:hypothetical protein [Verrucomicrobiota bacterium]MDE3097938.1 hypothetical protein [Verrucomicrobiota bacterium]